MTKKTCNPFKVFESIQVEGNPMPHCLIEAVNPDGTTSRSLFQAPLLTDLRQCHRIMIQNHFTGPSDFGAIKQHLHAAVEQKSKANFSIATRVGWHDGEYVLPWKTVSPAPSPKWIHMEALSAKQDATSSASGDLVALINRRVKHSDYLLFATSCAFVAPMLDVLGETEGFALYLWGHSTTGKTTLLSVANALTKPIHARKFRQFDFTQRGQEELCFEHNDTLLCLDEISAMGVKELQTNLTKIVYSVANGYGKRRSHAAAIAREVPDLSWRTVTLITGELALSSLPGRDQTSGQDTRFIGVGGFRQQTGGIFPESSVVEAAKWTKALSESSEKYSGDEFYRWIELLVRHKERIAKQAKLICDEYALLLAGPEPDSLCLRRARKFAIIATVGRILSEEKLFGWKKGKPLAAVKRIYNANTVTGAESPSYNEDAVRYARTLITKLVTTKRFQFMGKIEREPANNPYGIVKMTEDTNFIGIHPDRISEVFDEIDRDKVYEALLSTPGMVLRPAKRSSVHKQISYNRAGESRRDSLLVLDYRQTLKLARRNWATTSGRASPPA